MSISSYRRQIAVLTILIALFLFGGSIVYRIASLPSDLRLAPGQDLKLSLKGPFRFYLPPNSSLGFIGEERGRKISVKEGGLCSTVMLKPLQEGISEIQVRLFGIPLRNVKVNVLRLPAVYAGGQAVGVLIAEEGVVVVGTTPVKDDLGKSYFPARQAGIQVGDLLLSINNRSINRLDQLESMVQNEAAIKTPMTLKVRRGSALHYLEMTPIKQTINGQIRYRMGVYVEDPAAGVGTMTFIAEDLTFGALGHRIIGFGQQPVSLENGRIVQARITGVRPGARGEPGEKIGIFASNDDIIGDIQENTPYGIFGKLRIRPSGDHSDKPYQVALVGEVKTGPAEILTVLSGERIQRFDVRIQKVFAQSQPNDKGMVIKVVDPELLRKTGGIIQGMSGSPIIQDGKLVGAVTHVFVNDPTQGYGVFAEWMLKASGYLDNKEEDIAS